MSESISAAKAPSVFNGNHDAASLDDWLFAMTRWFTLRNITDPCMRTLHASTYLEGKANTWFMSFTSDHQASGESEFQVPPWDFFYKEIKQFFAPVNAHQTLRDQWFNLRQTRSVQDYITAFKQLQLKLQPTEDESKDKFVRGLQAHIQREVAIKSTHNSSLLDLFSIADCIDVLIPRNRPQSVVSRLPRPSAPSFPPPLAPMEIDATQTRPKKLSPEERTHRFQNNLCMYCGKSGHFRNDCPERRLGKANVQA